MHLTKGLYPFWDDLMTDTRFTDAVLSVNKANKEGSVLVLDRPWETAAGTYVTILKDDGLYRMYYQVWPGYPDENTGIDVCYAESRDGIHWERPNLGLYEFEGNFDNNFIIRDICDNIFVMKDSNPACPPEHRYKAVLEGGLRTDTPEGCHRLMCMTSPDGIHFKNYGIISEGYGYDSQNTLQWNRHTGKYYCYFRETRPRDYEPNPNFNEVKIRGIRVMESEDCLNWSEPTSLDYMGGEDYPLYTNCVSAYPYDDRYYIGFPTRYVERKEWNSNYDRLCGREERQRKCAINKRYGLAVTDCVFMSSRDNKRWYRFDEATVTPGPEVPTNWIYGNCYPAGGGVLESPSRFEGEPNELSIYIRTRLWNDSNVAEIVRYTYRIDGFASYKADYRGKTLRTKQFTFDGNKLSINFRTSARGSVYITVLDELGIPIKGYTTYEIFGDSINRIVDFEKSLSDLHGRRVSLEFKMSDAEIFSFRLS